MALKSTEVKLISEAIKKGGAIIFEYYPNKTENVTLKGDRICLAINLFKSNGKFYFFGYFLSGSSVSKGIGYRLYFQKGMYNVRNTSVRLNFSTILKIKLFAKFEQVKLLFSKKIES